MSNNSIQSTHPSFGMKIIVPKKVNPWGGWTTYNFLCKEEIKDLEAFQKVIKNIKKPNIIVEDFVESSMPAGLDYFIKARLAKKHFFSKKNPTRSIGITLDSENNAITTKQWKTLVNIMFGQEIVK